MTTAIFTLLQPFIGFLGTLCLVALAAGGILYVVFRLVAALVKPILFLSSCVVIIAAAALAAGLLL